MPYFDIYFKTLLLDKGSEEKRSQYIFLKYDISTSYVKYRAVPICRTGRMTV